MKKKIFVTATIAAAIALVLVFYKLDLWGSGEATAENSPYQENVYRGIPIKATVVKTSTFEEDINITGTVQANESMDLKSEREGKITHIYFEEGENVAKGDLLLQTNEEEIKAQIQKQKFNIELNQEAEERQRKLFKKEAISKKEYDDALNELNTNKAEMAILNARLEQTKIRAPFAGFIGFRHVSIGAYITTNTIIATLYNLNPVKIEFYIPSRYSGKVKKGQNIEFTTDQDKQSFTGKVYAIEPQININTRTLGIRALAKNPKNNLLPGQLVNINFILASSDNAILVPSEAVLPDLGGFKAYTVSHGKAKEVKIEIGRRNRLTLQVISGLQPNDTLITEGVIKMYPGADAQIIDLN